MTKACLAAATLLMSLLLLPTAAQARVPARSTFDYEMDFTGSYTSNTYEISASGKTWQDVYYLWAEVTYFACVPSTFICRTETRLSASGTIDINYPGSPPVIESCTISSNPNKASNGTVVYGLPPRAIWHVPDRVDPTLGLKVEPPYKPYDPCHFTSTSEAPFLPFTVDTDTTPSYCTALPVTQDFKDAYVGNELTDLPKENFKFEGGGRTEKVETCGPAGNQITEAQQVLIDDDVSMGAVGKLHGSFHTICNKTGCLLLPDGLAILNGCTTPPAGSHPVVLPENPPGLFDAEVYGKVLPPAKTPGSVMDVASGSYQRLATASATWKSWTPFDTVVVHEEAAAVKMLKGKHNPIELKVVERFLPKGSTKSQSYTFTETLLATQ
jgi:hypothetical protein